MNPNRFRLGIGENGFNTLWASKAVRPVLGSVALKELTMKFGSKVIKFPDEEYVRIVPPLADGMINSYRDAVLELVNELDPDAETEFEIREIAKWSEKEPAGGQDFDDPALLPEGPDAA